ncbi:TetR/AcrR family transcriptional regulator [Sphingomonas sp. UV9]|uniref:TetR/AcrR family transcriptional regulator n=1 Tax=Sphingomonas sp. UV9 TaxID=1851410 RepID=UPI000FFC3330|nr:TetR/AcrR family transcriptional regulator [Sphingomonas sp. UV9]RXD04772.1 TetR/AcrR family transcriptional regulator [Sphingomonas sp. UV9]
MQKPGRQSQPKKVRADGQRNRTAILTTARLIFREKGSAASLEEIARAAGVGNGTLYRHFPSRDALVDAVCHDDARGLIEAAAQLGKDHQPIDALLYWLDAFIDHVAERNIVIESVSVLTASAPDSGGTDGADVRAALLALFDRTITSDDSCVPIDPFDVLRAIAGIATISPSSDWPDRAKRLVRTIIAGLQQPLSNG